MIDDLLLDLDLETTEDPGLHEGCAGIALGLHAVATSLEHPESKAEAKPWLMRAFHGIAAQDRPLTLADGAVGVAWAAQQMTDVGLELDLGAVDEAVSTSMQCDYFRGHSGVHSGLAGLLFYGLERTDPGREVLVEAATAHLERLRLPSPYGLLWWTERELQPQGWRYAFSEALLELGAHRGAAGILAVLTRAARREGQPSPSLQNLLREIVSAIETTRLEASESDYPPYLRHGVTGQPSSMAWCSGDLGIAAALHAAGTALEDLAVQRRALQTMKRSAHRTPDASGVTCSSLCQGSAGVGHAFHRLFRRTGEAALQTAALRWFERTLDSLEAMDPPARSLGPGLLTGRVGIAAALASALDSRPCTWDRALLLC